MQRADVGLASKTHTRGLFDAVTCGVLVRDVQSLIIDANVAATEITGLPLNQPSGRQWSAAMQDAIREDGSPLRPEERPLAIVLRTGAAVRGQVRGVRRPDGEQRWIQMDTVPTHAAGGGLGDDRSSRPVPYSRVEFGDDDPIGYLLMSAF